MSQIILNIGRENLKIKIYKSITREFDFSVNKAKNKLFGTHWKTERSITLFHKWKEMAESWINISQFKKQ